MGFSFFASSLTEAFIAPFVKPISNKIGGPYSGMAISSLGYSITFLSYYLSQNAFLVLPINLVAGITYPMFVYSSQEELFRLTHPNCLNIMFTIDRSIYSGVGGGLAGILGGSLYKSYGGRTYG